MALLAGWLAYRSVPAPLPELTREQFLAEVQSGHVQTVIVEDDDVILATSSTRGRFRTRYSKRTDAALLTALRAAGVTVEFHDSGPPGF